MYYLTEEYRLGDLRKHLDRDTYRRVTSMDIGDGTVQASEWREENGTWQCRPLRLGPGKDSTEIPSYLSYTDSGVRIGEEALAHPRALISHFKRPPTQWEETDGDHTNEERMEDFIRAVWDRIVYYACLEEPDWPDQERLLVVGCPASADWLDHRDDYQRLVERATGCGRVKILPEPVAALIHETALCGRATGQGLAIYLFGASTTEFLYVQLGQKLITRSIHLGGAQIDAAMLRKALADSGLTRRDVPQGQRRVLQDQLRRLKEGFCSHSVPSGQDIPIWCGDQIGEPEHSPDVPRHEPGKKLKFTLDERFMRAVLHEDTDMNQSGAYRDKSWCRCMEQFFRDTKDLIGPRPCACVVLTGGTSHVPDLYDIAGAVYPDSEIVSGEAPSAAVAMGLCRSLNREPYFPITIDWWHRWSGLLNQMEQELFSRLDTYQSPLVCQAVRNALRACASTGKAYRLKELAGIVRQQLTADPDLTGNNAREKIWEVIQGVFICYEAELLKEINSITRCFYGVEFSSLNAPEMPPAMKTLKLEQFYDEELIYDLTCAIAQPLSSKISDAVYFGIGDPKLSPRLLAQMADGPGCEQVIQSAYQEFFDVVTRFGSVWSVRSEVYEMQTELCLGKALFLLFEEKADLR